MLLGYYMDEIDKRWLIHHCTRHMETDSIFQYRMLYVNCYENDGNVIFHTDMI